MSLLRPMRLGALVLTLALLAGCDDGEVGGPSSETLASVPGMCRTVAEHFGHTMQGPCATEDLLTILHALYAGGDLDDLGFESRNLSQFVDDACRSSACAADATVEQCIVRLESALRGDVRGCGAPVCGDGICHPAEFVIGLDGQVQTSCPEECSCGNGVCEPERGENETDCWLDCTPICGDGRCRQRETCGPPPPDDGPVDPRVRCDQDCCALGWYARVCGDGLCAPDVYPLGPENGWVIEGEDGTSCEADCGDGRCGDGVCLPPERFETCPADCATADNCRLCPECERAREHCGDGLCAGCEVWTCALDCTAVGFAVCTRDESGAEHCPAAWCGDATCAGDPENALTCPQDCLGTAPAFTCGDGYCGPDETDDPNGVGALCEVDCAR